MSSVSSVSVSGDLWYPGSHRLIVMAADATRPKTKITYATMTADRMEDLHRELDRAIEQVKSTFGRSYPLVIGGHEVRVAG